MLPYNLADASDAGFLGFNAVRWINVASSPHRADAEGDAVMAARRAWAAGLRALACVPEPIEAEPAGAGA